MSNTIGTVIRIFFLLILLVGGWFITVALPYMVAIAALNITFEWTHLWILFGSVIAIRMAYPRNVFQGSV